LLRSIVPHAVAVFGSKTRVLKMHKIARVLGFDPTINCYRAEVWIDQNASHKDLGIDKEKKLIYIGKNWFINWKTVDF
jgi:hypothetical protein